MKPVIAGTLTMLLVACNGTGDQSAEQSIDDVWHQAKLRGVAFRALVAPPCRMSTLTYTRTNDARGTF